MDYEVKLTLAASWILAKSFQYELNSPLLETLTDVAMGVGIAQR